MTVHKTGVVIEFHDGTVVKQSMGLFEDEDQGVAYATDLSESLSALLAMKVGDSGYTFEESLSHLGIARIAHDMETLVPVTSSKIVKP